MKRAAIKRVREKPDPVTVDPVKVGEMLRDSMKLHLQAKECRRKQQNAVARDALLRAAALRRDAHVLDPNHESPAWMEEQTKTPEGRDTHRELMDFYRAQGAL